MLVNKFIMGLKDEFIGLVETPTHNCGSGSHLCTDSGRCVGVLE
jgi:hypothetical protein